MWVTRSLIERRGAEDRVQVLRRRTEAEKPGRKPHCDQSARDAAVGRVMSGGWLPMEQEMGLYRIPVFVNAGPNGIFLGWTPAFIRARLCSGI